MRLADVPKSMAILNPNRQDDIRDYVGEFRSQPGINEVLAPTYGLPDDQFFVLDGNHRLSALTLNSVPFCITLWNIRGPIDKDALLDLIHWTEDPVLQT